MKMLPGVGLGTTLEVSPDLGPGMPGRMSVYCFKTIQNLHHIFISTKQFYEKN